MHNTWHRVKKACDEFNVFLDLLILSTCFHFTSLLTAIFQVVILSRSMTFSSDSSKHRIDCRFFAWDNEPSSDVALRLKVVRTLWTYVCSKLLIVPSHLSELKSKVKQSSYSRQLQLILSILLSFIVTAFWACCLNDATGKYLDVFTLQKFQLLLVMSF